MPHAMPGGLLDLDLDLDLANLLCCTYTVIYFVFITNANRLVRRTHVKLSENI